MTVFNKTFSDLSKFVIWADGADGGKAARLTFSFRDGNPRLVVYTGVQGKEGIINFPSDVANMTYVLSTIEDIAKGEPGDKRTISSMGSVYVDNKPSNEKRVISNLHIGKSKEGIVYLSLISENKPKVVFMIKRSPFHVIKDRDGKEVSEADISVKISLGIVDFLKNIISLAVMQHTVEEYTTVRKATPINEGGYVGDPASVVGGPTTVTSIEGGGNVADAVPGTAELDEIAL